MRYDVVVLGAGPGGYVSAIRAAQLGAKTAIVEKNKVGGTCLNVGCIPTKALIKNAEILHSIELGKKRGIKVLDLEIDYKRAVKTKDNAVKQLVNGVEGLLASNGVDVFRGVGCVGEGKTITVNKDDGNIETIEYGKLIIATGSKPAVPPIKGADLDGVMTNEELLKMESVPEHLIIIGGGVIGCEFASIFSAYGGKVTIIEMMPALVAMLDRDVSRYMGNILKENGVDLKLGKQVTEISRNANGVLEVSIIDKDKQQEILYGSQVLISVGRRNNLEGLEGLNLEMDRNFIVVNDRLETSVPDVYAIGDVAARKQLAHVASEMGIVAAENAIGKSKKADLSIVPSCIYTIPEVGSVGLSEDEAKEIGHEIIVGKFPLMACGKAVATGESEGIFKVIADKKTRKILGAHLIGKSATEIIAEMVAYIKMGATLDDVSDTIHAHPTISEAVLEAVRDADGYCIHMPKRK